MPDIENIEIHFLSVTDYPELKEAMKVSYPTMPEYIWTSEQIHTLISKFPEGQVVIKVNGQFAGCALSIRLDSHVTDRNHTYIEVTGNYTFSTHLTDGNILYGLDVFIKPGFRGLRLGRRLYDYRKELCEKLNLKGIVFGGRIPNYHQYAAELTPKEYIKKVREREIHDPVLNFQLSNDFHPMRILKGYLERDKASGEYAVLLEWDNIYYEEKSDSPVSIKKSARIGLIQWQMRLYKDIAELIQQAEFFIDAVSGYRADFALFPEFFNAPLSADYNHMSGSGCHAEYSTAHAVHRPEIFRVLHLLQY